MYGRQPADLPGAVRLSSLSLTLLQPSGSRMQLRSSRISVMLQGRPEIVWPSKRQADLRFITYVHWHVKCLHTSLGLTCRDRELRSCLSRDIRQLGPKLYLRQTRLHQVWDGHLEVSLWGTASHLYATSIGCHGLIFIDIVYHF